jgi:hypothetical protein
MKTFTEEYVSFEELVAAYHDCQRHKRKTANAMKFEIDECNLLYKLWVDLNSKTYEIGKSITFIVTKPVKREVFAADFRDRIVHHLIIGRTNDLFENNFIDDSYSCRDNKGVEYGVLQCKRQIEECTENYTKKAYILKCDLKSFFMSIDKNILFDKLKNFLTESGKFNERDLEYNLWLINRVVFNNPTMSCVFKQPKYMWKGLPTNKSLFYCDDYHGLPIGNLTSQIFANFYLSDFDHWVKEELGCKYYGRYVDDFFIISQDKEFLKDCRKKIMEKVKEFGVTLHPNKCYMQDITKGIQFIGTIIKPNRTYIISRTVGSLYNKLDEYKEEFEKYPNDIELIHKLASTLNSYLGFMIHRNSFNIRAKIFTKWKNSEFIFKYLYIANDNLSKVSIYKEYCDSDDNLRKHNSKETYIAKLKAKINKELVLKSKNLDIYMKILGRTVSNK